MFGIIWALMSIIIVCWVNNKITKMPTHLKRAKTPNPLSTLTPNPNKPKNHPVSPSKSNSRTHKHAQDPNNKQNIKEENIQPNEPIRPAISLPIMSRENCHSPALTTIAGYTSANTYRNGNGNYEAEQSLKIALELAEYHKKQMETYKAKYQEANDRASQLEGQLRESEARGAQLEEQARGREQKYRKLKQKYKESKKYHNKQTKKEDLAQQSDLTNDKQLPEPQSHNLISLHQEIQTKNKTIRTLCQQVSQCEQNTQNILKLIGILEQRVQQLNMDNSLLKGMLRERQVSESQDMSRCGFGSVIMDKMKENYHRVSFGNDRAQNSKGSKERDALDYGIVHFQRQ